MKIAIIGSGYVGLVAAGCFAELEHDVLCVDNDATKLAALARGECPIHEEFLPELLKDYRGNRLVFTDDLCGAVAASEVVFITVGTPPGPEGGADLSSVEQVAREIARGVVLGNGGYKVIVEKSTVPVFTAGWVRRVLTMSGAPRRWFDVASNPEFLREGTAVCDFLCPDRIVVGVNSERAAEKLRAVYAPLTTGAYYRRADAIPPPDNARIPPPLIETSTRSAELIKQASNAYLALRVSFINAVANLCEATGADVDQVREGLGADARIGRRFLRPGIGYGGSCFPKDLDGFRDVAAQHGCDFRLLDEVKRINAEQRERFLRKVREALWTLPGKRLAVLGLAFKGGTDDVRESPAIAVAGRLLAEGASVVAYDPAAMPRARKIFAKEAAAGQIEFAEDAYAAAEGADALLVLTDWEEFAALDLGRLREALRCPVMVDGRNVFPPARMAEEGFFYTSMGRPAAEPRRALKVKKAS
ncbi:MAG: UDP-glucose/GDP-mannose dehydrogenase family protein [Candidatus Koribacter versatilis]|uniref:UDP-glucose 6-dehydrogenase n=1 Tax=Candidatus Korobacter versatilis TaxID=658062 RepID=A0A932ERL9_9BACT|nr:UDP-glucose/GDP-mannose dehydrogenase family protein [Candidatus Koribacter versatilis]